MSDTFGALYLQGNQIDLPGGGVQGIGPFAVPCSGVQYTNTVALDDNTVTVPLPGGAQGVLLVPPASGNVAWSYKFHSGDTGVFGSQSLPSFVCFDSNNYPSDLYLTSAGSVAIVVQFI